MELSHNVTFNGLFSASACVFIRYPDRLTSMGVYDSLGISDRNEGKFTRPNSRLQQTTHEYSTSLHGACMTEHTPAKPT